MYSQSARVARTRADNGSSNVVLSGLGGWLPARAMSNADISAGLDTTPEWIESRTGIRERRMVSGGEASSDLAIAAARRALESAGIATVDSVVVATTSPDRPCPATAPEVAAGLGLGRVGAFDVNSACSGFLYGLATGAGLISTGVELLMTLKKELGVEPTDSQLDEASRVCGQITVANEAA